MHTTHIPSHEVNMQHNNRNIACSQLVKKKKNTLGERPGPRANYHHCVLQSPFAHVPFHTSPPYSQGEAFGWMLSLAPNTFLRLCTEPRTYIVPSAKHFQIVSSQSSFQMHRDSDCSDKHYGRGHLVFSHKGFSVSLYTSIRLWPLLNLQEE